MTFYIFIFKLFLLLFYYSYSYFSPFALLWPSHSPLPQSIPTLLSMFMDIHTGCLSSPFPFFQPLSSPGPSHFQFVPCFHARDAILFAILFCSLDSSYRWIHTIFVFHWLAYFTQHNILQFHPCCHKRYKFFLSFFCVVFHCVVVPQFFDPLLFWWARKLFPALGYCK